MKEFLSFDEKFVSAIFEKYLLATKILANQIQEYEPVYGQLKIDQKELANYRNHCQIVETILALISEQEYRCLINDFLKQNDCYWWKKYYCQSEYLTLKTKAINTFLYLFLV